MISKINQKYLVFIITVLFLGLTFFTIKMFIDRSSFGLDDGAWDGESVANEFAGGNGSKDNPYLISSPEEFIYFKNLLEGEESLNYQDKYYQLTNNINLGNHPITSIGSIEEEKIFKGSLDGDGYQIENIDNSIPVKQEDNLYYGLFLKTKDASIKNLIIKHLVITISPYQEEKLNVSLLTGEVMTSEIKELEEVEIKSQFENILIEDFTLDLREAKEKSNLAVISNNLAKNSIIKNLSLEGEVLSSFEETIPLVSSEYEGELEKVLVNIKDYNYQDEKIKDLYYLKDQKIYNNNQEVNSTDLVNSLNEVNDQYLWSYQDYKFSFTKKVVEESKVPSITPSFKAPPRKAARSSIPLHDSGIEDNKVYVNDLESDYNYYMGLNYTTSPTETTPTGENRGIYTSDNLVKVYIHYSGKDVNDDNIYGTVSNTEAYQDIYYYKYYPVVDGYVSFDLIDNPWANRPRGLAFNGWACNFEGSEISLNSGKYIRSVKIPYNGEEILEVEFLTSWTTATTVTSASFTNLKAKGMVHYESTSERIYEDVSNYYVLREIGWYTNYPTGSPIYNTNGTRITATRCTSLFGCSYLIKNNTSEFDDSETYYKLTFNGGTNASSSIRYTPTYTILVTPYFHNGENVAGNFERVTLSNGQSREGLYDNNGNILTGNCTSNTCNYYKLVNYYDENGNLNIADANKEYYYLVTRDTNIMVLSGTTSGLDVSKPVTVTGLNNGTLTGGTLRLDNSDNYSIVANADLRLEYLNIQSSANNSSSMNNNTSSIPSNSIIANYNNLKIGRGINVTNNKRIAAVWGGTGLTTEYTRGSSNSLKQYSIIVESGDYNSIYMMEAFKGDGTIYTSATYIAGSDIDRVNNNNSSLDVYYALQGNAAPISIYGQSNTSRVYDMYIKSGTFGSSHADIYTGVYVGGRNATTVSGNRSVVVEGGNIYSLIGGIGTKEDNQEYNSIYINLKGGTVGMIFAGSGSSATYGNRIVNATGGKVEYAIFGGSNGSTISESSKDTGILYGDTFLYIGGNCQVGDPTITNSLYGTTSGNIFGIGNGNTNKDSLGSADNSHIIVDGESVIYGNVYGGGNFGSVGTLSDSNTCQTTITLQGGTVKGSVYGGGNNSGSGSETVDATVNINSNSGVVEGSIYGGSRTKGTIFGTSNVTINGGEVKTDVYGGGEGGYTDSANPGTFVTKDVNVLISSGTIRGSVYGGSAYGTVNASTNTATSSSYTTNVTVNDGVITENVFGGAKGSSDFEPKVVGDITVTINGGSIGNVYGGFDASGTPTAGDVVYLNGGTIGNAFGGGRNVDQTSTDIRLQGSTITDSLYGGSNLNGTITTSNVTITSGSVTNVYGGNNVSGTTVNSNVTVEGGTITGDIYGGGNEAPTTTSTVTISNTTVNNVYGGGKQAGVTTTNVILNAMTGNQVYGGSNVSGDVTTSNVTSTSSNLNALYGGNNKGGTCSNSNLTINTSTITDVFGGGNDATTGSSNITMNSGTITNLFGGGNNSGGYTTSTNVDVNGGSMTNIYGGGNQARTGSTLVDIAGATATDVFGGGNAAGVDQNTSLRISSSTISNNVYGGGDEGVVSGNTDVYIHNATILGNAFAGGNGSSAIVYGNSTITIDGPSVIGSSSSEAPNGGCVFGSGNAASTGDSTNKNSKATVNLVGGKVYGNVYGGPKMAVVYGTTETNIGYQAVNNSNLTEDNIHIVGTVFGGGESNASGSETYDWTFISVTNGIDVNIDGTDYDNHNHTFIINGSIFGSGNASSSSGDSNVYIKNLGNVNTPNKSISIQRANNLVIDSSVIELEGTTDRTNEYSDILYSFNMIDKLVLKNNSRLLLKHNANMLKEFYSGVDSGGELTPAVVNINDDTKEVTKNVDNRVYMKPGQNLNITVNQGATAYGKVTGMTFFGMYQQYDNGLYHYGLYDDDINYGDSGSASLQIVGGSYAIGLHHANHDITKDGFYSNFLDEDFTEVSTAYIDPSPIGETGYRWIIGFEAINYNFTLTASKYSSLGTYELQLIDFADGNTNFSVIDFDATALNSGLSLVDSNEVPRVARTETEANSIYGLSMKEETQEWTSYGTTKFLSNSQKYTGDTTNKTDTRKLPPSLMFYLYHAKNINCEGPLGTVVITLRADIPKNAIDYDIKYITITIDLVARKYDDGGSYDASITYDKKYEMPSTTSVNITNQSQFTTYYSFLDFPEKLEDMYGKDNDNYHVLTTNTPLPENTYITMLDFAQREDRPVYYYFKVTHDVYENSLTQLANYNEVTYRLSDFILMDSTSTNNTYDDATANLLYYDEDSGLVDEEFMFIFDFKDTTTTGNHENNTMLFELRNNEDRSVYEVLGIRQGVMVYNTYQSSNVVLNQTVTDTNPYIYYGVPHEIGYTTSIQYDETENRQSVIDTNYESSSMGMNVTIFDRNNDPVSSSLLIGTSVTINNQEYFADSDGVFRIKLAGKVTNLDLTPKINATKDLPAGEYTIRYTLFASDDGLHNSSFENMDTDEYTIYVVNADNSISVTCDDKIKIVNGETGLNLNETKLNPYTITYESELSNPNLRIEVYKRKTNDINSVEYESIPLENLFKNRLTSANNGNEYRLNIGEGTTGTVSLELQDTLTSGTYRISFKLYDNNQFIDDDIKYVIVKKKTE